MIQALTAIGRVTVRLLKMNDEEPKRLRRVMIELGVILPAFERGWP
jgi:hypothetical protein